jgi:hypothetical protein
LIELSFHREIYAGPSIDEAVKIFASYATFELEEQPEHWRVRITAASPERERRIAGELGNFALGLTIKSGGKAGGKPGDTSRDESGGTSRDASPPGQKASA